MLVPDSPAVKRQKTASGYNSTANNSPEDTGAYNSDNDDGDELFKDYVPDTPKHGHLTQPTQLLPNTNGYQTQETQLLPQNTNGYQTQETQLLPSKITNEYATQPTQLLPNKQLNIYETQQTQIAPPKTSNSYETQPTQILDKPSPPGSSPPQTPHRTVQVPASSPFTVQGSPIRNGGAIPLGMQSRTLVSPPSGNLAAGFKPTPQQIQQMEMHQRQVQAQNTFRHSNIAMSMAPAGTSFQPPRGIVPKPSPTKTFVDLTGDEALKQGGSSDSDDGGLSRGNIKPSTFLPKSGHNSLSGKPGINGNGRFSEFVNTFKASNPNMGAKQTRPDRARPVEDLTMDSLSDAQVRENVIRIRRVLPHITMHAAKNALVTCRGSLEQAMELLGGEGTRDTDSDIIEIGSDDEIQMMPARDQPQMMRGLNAPTVSIRDKYSSTQALPARKSSQVSTPQPKPKRKLMQGRRNPSSPAVPIASSPLKPQSSPVASLHDSFDSDSGVASAEEEEDPGLAHRLLKYLNTCKVEELIELTNTTKDNAEAMINARPFHDLDIARTVENSSKTLKSGKKSKKAPIGDKIVDTAMDMFRGYEAIDALCAKCEDLGRGPAEEMTKWGLDVFGASKAGELEMTSLEDDADSLRDSGIGSPSSGTASPKHNAEDDIRIVATKRKRGNVNFLKKPELMAEDCVLKDYQVVGLNWLNLMYQKKLSCILADEMGLGKTCQVIAFISHLVEIGHTGPHLVVCPGSTLENWLRECNRFAPELTVEPYHGRYCEHSD